MSEHEPALIAAARVYLRLRDHKAVGATFEQNLGLVDALGRDTDLMRRLREIVGEGTPRSCCSGWRRGLESGDMVEMADGVSLAAHTSQPFKFCPWCRQSKTGPGDG